MKRQYGYITFWLLVLIFSFPIIARAQEIVTIVQLNNDFFRIKPGESASLDITSNDTIEHFPSVGWMLEIGQPGNQDSKFGWGYESSQPLWKIHLTIEDPMPGYYIYHYFLTWPNGRSGADVKVTVLNWDGSDPPQPRSPLSPLYIPLVRGRNYN